MATERDIAFPILTRGKLEQPDGAGPPRAVRAGEVLFREGGSGFGVSCGARGAVEIVVHPREGEHR